MIRYRGAVYRAHDPKWSFDPLSGEGAARLGGRFNPVGVPTLYTSVGVETAIAEVSKGGLCPPVTIVAYLVDCADVVDLSTAAARRKAKIASRELDCPWEAFLANGQTPPSWDLASRMIASGAAGLLVPSFAPNAAGTNLVLWKFGPDPPYRIVVHDHLGRLPRDQSSWSSP